MLRQKVAASVSLVKVALPHAGIDAARARRAIVGVPRFARQYRELRRRSIEAGLTPPTLRTLLPVLGDDAEEAGGYVDRQYLHQDIWAARKLFQVRPQVHVDIGSRIDGFISSALVFCDVMMIDVRPMERPPQGLTFKQADATALPFEDGSVQSLSSLHALEHFGLGRYGDPIDPMGSLRGLQEISRVAAPGGRVYIGIPIGRERVMFNAHRVHLPSTIIDAAAPLRLLSFSAVDDHGSWLADADPQSFGDAAFSCGLFEFGRDA